MRKALTSSSLFMILSVCDCCSVRNRDSRILSEQAAGGPALVVLLCGSRVSSDVLALAESSGIHNEDVCK